MDIKPGNSKNIEQLLEQQALVPSEPKPTRSRRPYQKPAFRFERVFETAALSCGKVSITQFQCMSSQKTS
jgi:hypothetical protein